MLSGLRSGAGASSHIQKTDRWLCEGGCRAWEGFRGDCPRNENWQRGRHQGEIKNELRSYLRAMNVQDGKSRKGFVVTFPCTANKKQAETPGTTATVEEVTVEEQHVGTAAQLSGAVGKLLRVVSKV